MKIAHLTVPLLAAGILLAAAVSQAQLRPCVSSRFIKSHTLDDPGANGPTPGDIFTYTVEFCHGTGNDACVFEDNLPTGLAVLPASVACVAPTVPDVCAALSASLIQVDFSTNGLPVGSCCTLTFDAQVLPPPPPLPAQFCNQASNSDPTLPVPDQSNLDCEAVTSAPSMQLTKTATDVNAGDLGPGDIVHYVITVANTNPSIPLTGVDLDDVLPAEIDVARTCPIVVQSPDIPLPTVTQDCTTTPATLSISGFDLATPNAVRFEFDVALGCALGDGQTVRNVVTGSSAEIPPGPGGPAAVASLTAATATINGVTKVPDQTSVGIPGTVTYTFQVSAGGTGTATGVRLIDDLTAQGMGTCFDLAAGTASCGACYNPATGLLDATLPAITSSTPATVTLALPTRAVGTCRNTASAVQQVAGGACPDVSLSSTEASVTVTSGPVPNLVGSTKNDNIPASSSVTVGDPMTYSIVLTNTGSGPASNVVVTDVLPACLDDAGFCLSGVDCSSQVVISPGPGTSSYDSATRTLTINLASVSTLVNQTIAIDGLVAGTATPACCNQARITHSGDPAGIQTADSEVTSCPTLPCQTCTQIEPRPGGCSPLPPIVNALLAVRLGSDVAMSWSAATDPSTAMYDIWKVVNGDKTLIPTANKLNVGPAIQAAGPCTDIPKATPGCTDPGAVPPPPGLLYYQVRGACSDGTEGTSHPF